MEGYGEGRDVYDTGGETGEPPMTAAEDAAPATATAPTAPAAAPARRCENCGSPLYGEHCFACGQPTKGLVRHFSSILGDFFDTVFNIDSRVLRTIGPLLVRPGYLSLEYFAGRRVRYVTPMRLFLFLSLVAFFAVHANIDVGDDDDGKPGGLHIGAPQRDSFEEAKTVAEVEQVRKQALVELQKARKAAGNVPMATVGIDIGIDKVNDKAKDRLARLAAEDAAREAGKPLPAEDSAGGNFDMQNPCGAGRWDPQSNPIACSWLPAAANRSLNRRMAHAATVLKDSKSGKPIVDALFNVLPQTLLVMMPLFALMLKLAYLFKRRLYMEHLIVALHSHSFMALAVTVVMGLSGLLGLVPATGLVHSLLGFLRVATIVWIPLYLLLMQKRVYGQGWPMTIAKYAVLGIAYSVLMSFALIAAVILGLLTL
jgi:hypothetical protein